MTVNESWAMQRLPLGEQVPLTLLPYWVRVRMKLVADKQAPLTVSLLILNAWIAQNVHHPQREQVILFCQVMLANDVCDELIAEERIHYDSRSTCARTSGPRDPRRHESGS